MEEFNLLEEFNCWKNLTAFNSARNQLDLHKELRNITWMAEAFLLWDFDPDTYGINYWLLYYRCIEYHYSDTQYLMPQYLTWLLQTCLVSMLKFNKVKEFSQIKQFWISNMTSKVQYLELNEINEILHLIEQRSVEMENLLSKDIVDKLYSVKKNLMK